MTTTRTTPSSHASPVVVIGILGLACMFFMAFLLYNSHERDRAKSTQEFSECLANSSYGIGPGVETCTARARAGAR